MRKIAFTHYPDYTTDTIVIETNATNSDIERIMKEANYPDGRDIIEALLNKGFEARLFCKIDGFYDHVGAQMM